MEELSVTQIWMSGVVGMMLVFGIIVLIGVRQNDRDHHDD